MITRSLTLALVTISVPALHAPLPGRKRVTMLWEALVWQASSGYAVAALVNPVLMTCHNTHDHVGVILPGVGVHVSDLDNLQESR